MKKISVIASVLLLFLIVNAYSKPAGLKFKNGKFKIMQFTDIHWDCIERLKEDREKNIELMRELINKEQPDLVVLTGDIVVSHRFGGVLPKVFVADAVKAWKRILQTMVDLKTPFAVTFGNHDHQAGITNKEVFEIITSTPFNVTYNADAKLSGIGNCTLPVRSDDGKKVKWMLYMIDSQNYTNDTTIKGYGWINNDQINWYRTQSKKNTLRNGNKPLPSLAFFHIPLPEYNLIQDAKETIGLKGEKAAPANLNSGMFCSFVEMKDVLGVFVGHDHLNDYIGKLYGVCLAYGRKTGYTTAYDVDPPRGARVIELIEDDYKFNTYIRDLNGISFNYSNKR
jgi:3',5'-cyclic AMP phosphodiesterase CpdA